MIDRCSIVASHACSMHLRWHAAMDGMHARLLKNLARVELLILDDWGLAPLTSQQSRGLLEIVDDRHRDQSAPRRSPPRGDRRSNNRRGRRRPPRAHTAL